MNPKVDFQTHELITRALIPYIEPHYLNPFEEAAADMRAFWHKNGANIAVAIQKYAGWDFKQDNIPVWLIPSSRYSSIISHVKENLEGELTGVIMRLRSDEDKFLRNQAIFIHELVHVIQLNNGVFGQLAQDDMTELMADLVCLYTIREVFGRGSELEKADWDFHSSSPEERNQKKYKELMDYDQKWDLTHQSFREFWQK